MKTPVPCETPKLLVDVAVLSSPLPLTVAVELPDREILLLNERLMSIRAWPPLTASSSAAPRVRGAGADSARASTETVAPAAMAPTAMAETKILFMTLPLILFGTGAPRL
jgi:hypothetical protein